MEAHLFGPLHIDVHHDVLALIEKGEHFGEEGAVVVAMHFGMFQ